MQEPFSLKEMAVAAADAADTIMKSMPAAAVAAVTVMKNMAAAVDAAVTK